MKIMIATPFYEQKGWSPYIRSMLITARVLDAAGVEWDWMELAGDSYVDRARNTLCARFLDTDADALVFIDSDLEWNAEGFLKLITAPAWAEVVAGAYPLKNEWDSWSSVPIDRNGQVIGRAKPKGGWLLEAEVLSAGFMMIRRGVLERMRDSYPQLAYTDERADPCEPYRQHFGWFSCPIRGGRRFGEDYEFCARLREMGVPLWIEPDISFGHYGTKGWEGNWHERRMDTAEDAPETFA